MRIRLVLMVRSIYSRSASSTPPSHRSPPSSTTTCSRRRPVRHHARRSRLPLQLIPQYRLDLIRARLHCHLCRGIRQHIVEPFFHRCLLIQPQEVRQDTQRLFRRLDGVVSDSDLQTFLCDYGGDSQGQRDGDDVSGLDRGCVRFRGCRGGGEFTCKLEPRPSLLGVDVGPVDDDVVASEEGCAGGVEHRVPIA